MLGTDLGSSACCAEALSLSIRFSLHLNIDGIMRQLKLFLFLGIVLGGGSGGGSLNGGGYNAR